MGKNPGFLKNLGAADTACHSVCLSDRLRIRVATPLGVMERSAATVHDYTSSIHDYTSLIPYSGRLTISETLNVGSQTDEKSAARHFVGPI